MAFLPCRGARCGTNHSSGPFASWCEEILSEPTPEALPDRIIDHLQKTFPVQWSTLWLTEQTEIGDRQLRLAAAGGDAKKLLTAENGEPAVYHFGEGLTGEVAQRRKSLTS